MLVLSRRQDQEIVIGDGTIVIAVLGIGRSGEVQIGVACDRSIPIVRAELKERRRPRFDGGSGGGVS